MPKFNVGIQGIEDTNRGANFNLQVEATDVVNAIDKAKVELLNVLKAAGLGIIPAVAADVSDPTIQAA